MTAKVLYGEIVPAGTGPRPLARPEASRRDEIAGKWILAKKRAHTKAAYLRDITQFFGWCDEFGFEALTISRSHADGYRNYLETGAAGRSYQPTTIARKLSAVSSFYDFACDEYEHLVPTNPLERVDRPDVTDESETDYLDLGELQRLFAAADASGLWEAALVRMLFYSAVRVSELCNARTSDLRMRRGHRVLTVIRKGGRPDQVVIPPPAAEALDRYLAGRTGFLFLRGGQQVTRHEVAYHLALLAEKSGIDPKHKRITPHSLRHTAATIALDEGQDIREVQRMLGHKRVETTMRYDRSRTNVDRSPAHALALAVEGERLA